VEALLRIFLQAVSHDPLEARRDALIGDGEIRRIFFQDRAHRVGWRVAVKRAFTGEHFVEDGAQCIDVGCRADLPDFATRLFRAPAEVRLSEERVPIFARRRAPP